MWHPSVVMRIILAILGVIALVVGVAAWSLETEYGGEGPGSMEMLPDGTVRVYDVDEQITDAEGHPAPVLVFEGTQEEADAWVEQRRSEGRSYLIPVLILSVGAVLGVGAVFPSLGGDSELDEIAPGMTHRDETTGGYRDDS